MDGEPAVAVPADATTATAGAQQPPTTNPTAESERQDTPRDSTRPTEANDETNVNATEAVAAQENVSGGPPDGDAAASGVSVSPTAGVSEYPDTSDGKPVQEHSTEGNSDGGGGDPGVAPKTPEAEQAPEEQDVPVGSAHHVDGMCLCLFFLWSCRTLCLLRSHLRLLQSERNLSTPV